MSHHTFAEDVDNGHTPRYRWACSCRRAGKPTTSKSYAERLGIAHEKRFAPKASGPKVLRDLLKFD